MENISKYLNFLNEGKEFSWQEDLKNRQEKLFNFKQKLQERKNRCLKNEDQEEREYCLNNLNHEYYWILARSVEAYCNRVKDPNERKKCNDYNRRMEPIKRKYQEKLSSYLEKIA